MRRSGMQFAIIIITCAAVSAPAEARPRLFRAIGALAAAPVAIIAGAANARARHHRERSVRAAPVSRRAAADIRPQARGAAPGWAGPLFWPHASVDLFDYVFGQSGGAERFWSYGYDDLLDGMFVTASIPDERPWGPRAATRVAETGSAQPTTPWQSKCGQTAPQIEALVERIRTRLQTAPEQNAALDAVRDALVQADAKIAKACPDAAATAEATERIDMMAARLIAMRQAASLVLPSLRKFYAMLDDKQKALFDGVDPDQTAGANATIRASAGLCAEAAVDGNWPTAKIARRVAPKGEQLADLERLRLTSASFGQFVTTTCADTAKNPIERLETARKRVNVIRYAVTHVSPALDQFYGSLNGTQKARFSSLGR